MPISPSPETVSRKSQDRHSASWTVRSQRRRPSSQDDALFLDVLLLVRDRDGGDDQVSVLLLEPGLAPSRPGAWLLR